MTSQTKPVDHELPVSSSSPGAPCEVVPEGAVYVVGDNIGGSVDSRHFGVVPADQIVGKLVLRLPVTRWLAR